MPVVLFAVDDCFEPINRYIVDCDVDARQGRGTIHFTNDINGAKRFPDLAAALAYWQRQSTVTPLRPDGRPNRPLTGLTIEPRTVASVP